MLRPRAKRRSRRNPPSPRTGMFTALVSEASPNAGATSFAVSGSIHQGRTRRWMGTASPPGPLGQRSRACVRTLDKIRAHGPGSSNLPIFDWPPDRHMSVACCGRAGSRDTRATLTPVRGRRGWGAAVRANEAGAVTGGGTTGIRRRLHRVRGHRWAQRPARARAPGGAWPRMARFPARMSRSMCRRLPDTDRTSRCTLREAILSAPPATPRTAQPSQPVRGPHLRSRLALACPGAPSWAALPLPQ